MVLGFAPDMSRLSEFLSLSRGKLLREGDFPTKGVILSVQNSDGEDTLYSIEFSFDSDARSFLEEVENYLHLKAVLKVESGELPFYVFCKAKRYEGSALYDPSIEFE